MDLFQIENLVYLMNLDLNSDQRVYHRAYHLSNHTQIHLHIQDYLLQTRNQLHFHGIEVAQSHQLQQSVKIVQALAVLICDIAVSHMVVRSCKQSALLDEALDPHFSKAGDAKSHHSRSVLGVQSCG